MFFQSSSVEYTLSVLHNNLGKIKAEISVYELGIIEEERELELMNFYYEALLEAVTFLQTSGVIVSLREFRNIKEDMAKSRSGISHKQVIIRNMKDVIRLRTKEAITIKQNIDKLTAQNRKGIILEFNQNVNKRRN